MVYLPSTSDFPPDPERLSRDDLNSVYRELRSCYTSSLRSRGQHRSLANKARAEAAELRKRLLALAQREGSVRADVYEMLEIVSAIAGDLEDAGDDLVNEFGRYKLGRRTYQGGSFLGGLIQAVIRFINRWTRAKEKVVELDKKRQAFIAKNQELPPISSGGKGHQGPVDMDAHQLNLQVANDKGAATEGGQHGTDR